jgi:leader peptidase (prepilin peptidase)/N-methyltransferase
MLLFIFIFGLIIGSFLNVCIYRIPAGKSIATPPSSCGSCGTRLKPLDLFPIVSWIFLGGKCRYCGESIAIRYPFVELMTGLLFSVVFWQYGMDKVLLPYLTLTAILISITFIDLDHQIIPNKINLFALGGFLVFNIILGYINWTDSLLGALIGGGFLFLLVIISKGAAMGMGDVKLMAVLGLYLGWTSIILTLLLSFIIGGVFGVLLLVLKIKGRKDAIPFGPWIAIAAFVTIVFGSNILTWYIALL